MTLPPFTRRAIIGHVPLLLGATLIPSRVFAAVATPLRFIVIGDWGRQGRPDQMAVANLARQACTESRCDFVISTGDNFYVWGVPSGSLAPWRTSYEDVYDASLKCNWLAVLGNHDYSGSVDAQITYRSPVAHGDRCGPPPWGWRMDNRWWELQLTYFGRPDIHLFFIDTVTWEGKESFPHKLFGAHIEFGHRERQRKWLAQSLAASWSPIKLVIGHHPIYSVGPHGGQMRLKELDDILRAGGVTAYIHGHDHCLYHIQQGGFDYICSGAGSQVLTKYTGGGGDCVLKDFCPNPAAPQPYLPIARSYFAKGGIGIVSVNANSMDFQFRTVAGTCSPTVSIPVRS